MAPSVTIMFHLITLSQFTKYSLCTQNMVKSIYYLQKEDNIMNKKLQVFVSSTYTDLIEERQAAVQAILEAGHIPAGMELFKAGKSQMKTIQKWIDDSDIYMLILGGRYGSIEAESGLSYTELEYRYALSKNIPTFAVLLDDSFLFTKASSKGKDAIFEKKNKQKFNSFKKYVNTNIIKFISNVDQILSIVHAQLNYYTNDSEYNLIGWTRCVTNENNLNDMSEFNDILKSIFHALYELIHMNEKDEFRIKFNEVTKHIQKLHMFCEINILSEYNITNTQIIFNNYENIVERLNYITNKQQGFLNSNDNHFLIKNVRFLYDTTLNLIRANQQKF